MGEDSTKYAARFLKKLSRSKAKLEKDGFTISDASTNCMVICNAGVANGVRRQELQDMISDFSKIITPARKSYAMVYFTHVTSAKKASLKLQGYVHKSDQNLATAAATFYVHFVESFNVADGDDTVTNNFRDVPGLEILEDFVSNLEERDLLNFLQRENPIEAQRDHNENILKNRQVWHYGYEFRYKHNDVDPKNPIPNGLPIALTFLIKRMKEFGLVSNQPNQITINKYEPGHGIPPHIDNPDAFDENLLSLSLGTQTVMDFRKDKRRVQVLLPPRSLIAFKGEARYHWTHGICPRKVDLIPSGDKTDVIPVNRGIRYSITFRRVKDGYEGPISNENVIDSIASQPVGDNQAECLEERHVHQVYNEIASHFTATREKPWPKVVNFIQSLKPQSLILDVGCGSGRYLGVREDVHMIGCDKSENLVSICKGKGHEVLSCDGLALPIKSCTVDASICIAVIHHYSTVERRIRAIKQLLRVTKPGGKILISVWALEQEYKRMKSKYLKPISKDCSGVPEVEPPSIDLSHSSEPTSALKDGAKLIPVHKNRTPFQQQDVLVPWHKKPSSATNPHNINEEKHQTFHRFYHVFKKGELDDLCRNIASTDILESYYDEGNWCVIIEKSNFCNNISSK